MIKNFFPHFFYKKLLLPALLLAAASCQDPNALNACYEERNRGRKQLFEAEQLLGAGNIEEARNKVNAIIYRITSFIKRIRRLGPFQEAKELTAQLTTVRYWLRKVEMQLGQETIDEAAADYLLQASLAAEKASADIAAVLLAAGYQLNNEQRLYQLDLQLAELNGIARRLQIENFLFEHNLVESLIALLNQVQSCLTAANPQGAQIEWLADQAQNKAALLDESFKANLTGLLSAERTQRYTADNYETIYLTMQKEKPTMQNAYEQNLLHEAKKKLDEARAAQKKITAKLNANLINKAYMHNAAQQIGEIKAYGASLRRQQAAANYLQEPQDVYSQWTTDNFDETLLEGASQPERPASPPNNQPSGSEKALQDFFEHCHHFDN